MKASDIIMRILILAIFLAATVIAVKRDSEINIIEKRRQLIEDSIAMQYYSRVLKRSYLFDHSKIPNNASDSAVRASR